MILLLFFSQETPLHRCVRQGHLETCRLLLECNANFDKIAGEEGRRVISPALITVTIFLNPKSSLCAFKCHAHSCFILPVITLHCINLPVMAALKSAVCW
jgi:hypothetical protein